VEKSSFSLPCQIIEKYVFKCIKRNDKVTILRILWSQIMKVENEFQNVELRQWLIHGNSAGGNEV